MATCSPWGSCVAHAACCAASSTGSVGIASAAFNLPPHPAYLTESESSAVQSGMCLDAAGAALHPANRGGLQPEAFAGVLGNMTALPVSSTRSPRNPFGRSSCNNPRRSTSARGPSRGWDRSRRSSTWRPVRNLPTSLVCLLSGQATSATLSLPPVQTSSSGECCSCFVTLCLTALAPAASPARAASCWRGARDAVVASSFLLNRRLLYEACADLVAAELKIWQSICYLVPQQAPTSTCICVN